MLIKDLEEYINNNPALTKMDLTIEKDEYGSFYIVKSKDTLVFEDEEQADAMINDLRTNPNFIGVEKKYKEGKLNKAGECLRPETWTLTSKLYH